MGRKKRSNRRKSSSSEEEEDDDDDEESESESSDDSQIQRRQEVKRSTLRQQSRKQTLNNKSSLNDQQTKKKVQIVVENDKDDFSMNKRSQYRKPTSVNRLRRTQEEDDKDDEQIMSDFNQDDDDNFQGRKKSAGRKKAPSKTIINTQNLVDLKSKAKQLNQQNLIIENLEQQLEQQQKQTLVLNLEQKQDIQEKEKDIQALNTQKSLLERKVGRQKTYIKKIKEKLNFRRGSLFNLQLERRNSQEEETIDSTNNDMQMFNLPPELQQRMLKKSSLLDKIVNFLQYNYPLSKIVHKILNFYTKNEELHFTYIAVNFNLSIIFFFMFLPFVCMQIASNISHFDSSKPFSIFMYHEYQSQNLTSFIVVFCFFIFVSTVIQYYRVSYVRKKDVESEAQSKKDLSNFKLVFSSVNFRLSNYEFMKKQQIALKQRVILSWKLNDRYVLKRKDYGNWIYALRTILIAMQIGMVVGTLFLVQQLNKQDLFSDSSSLVLKMPFLYAFICVIAASTVATISYHLTQFELWNTYTYAYHLRIWKSYLIQSLTLFYSCLQKSPLDFKGSDLSYIGLKDNFNYLYTNYNCAAEQLVYSLLSFYLAQFIWNLITMVLPNLLQILFRGKGQDQTDQILKRSAPFKVIEDTVPIIILNMIGNMLVPIFPVICLINAILHLVTFAINWQVIIRFRYQNYSSISRQFVMKALIQFYVLGNILSFIYYAIMSYQVQGDYFIGGDYTKNNVLRICGPLDINTTVAGSISDKVYSIRYVNYLSELISWVPLLWVTIIFLYCLQRLESKTKKVWRNEYFIKSKEMDTIKNYFQQRAKSYEDKISFAQNELQNLDTPKAKGSNTPSFFDGTPASVGKSKFSIDNKSFGMNTPLNNGGGIGGIGNLSINLSEQPQSPYSAQGFDDSKQSFVSKNNSIGSNLKLILNHNNNFSKFKPM